MNTSYIKYLSGRILLCLALLNIVACSGNENVEKVGDITDQIDEITPPTPPAPTPPTPPTPPAPAPPTPPTPPASGLVHDLKSQWAEGGSTDNDGATRDYYNRGARLAWINRMGDWHDSAGAAQGNSAYAIVTLPDDDLPGFHSWDVTNLVGEWMSGTVPNQGFFLRHLHGGGPVDFYSREHPVPEQRPELNIVTDMGSFFLAPVADTHLRSSSFGSIGREVTLRIRAELHHVLIRFDLSSIPADANVSSATLQLFSFAEFGGTLDVGVFRVFTDAGELPALKTGGLAEGFIDDVGIGAHPDVHVFTNFESANWGDVYRGWDSPTLERVTSGLNFEPVDGTALRATVPAGGLTGMNVLFNFQEQLGFEPTEVFFRYYLRFNQNWEPVVGGKLPGIAGRYRVAGWGGRKSDGTNGWSSRGVYMTNIPAQNPLAGHVPVGNYIYHTGMGRWGDNVLWQDGLLGLLEKDRWYSIEQRLVMNTPGLNDGITETWIDGRLAYRRTNWRWRNEGFDNIKIEQIWLNVYHGGTTPSATDISLYIDNIVIASSYIGPMTTADMSASSK